MCLLPIISTDVHAHAYAPLQLTGCGSATKQQRAATELTPQVICGNDPRRAATEAFIADRFQRSFCARLTQFMPTLVRLERNDGSLAAALGIRYAADKRLFVEDYLDAPAEQAIALATQRPASRHGLIEVGNLAIADGVHGRPIVISMARLLAELDCQEVIFAATAPLRASMHRLGLSLTELSAADPCRLGSDAQQWGDYYQSQPRVLCGAIGPGLKQLQRRGLL